MEVREFILQHADVPYDAAKRREYYLKTRELKGRKPGVGKTSPTSARPGHTQADVRKFLMDTNRKEIERRGASVEVRVKALNEKLASLRKILKGLKDQIGSRAKKTTDKTNQKDKAKPLTPTEKAKAAKEAKQRRDKAPDKPPDQKLKEITQKVEALQKQIKEARLKLQQKASVKNASPEKPKA